MDKKSVFAVFSHWIANFNCHDLNDDGAFLSEQLLRREMIMINCCCCGLSNYVYYKQTPNINCRRYSSYCLKENSSSFILFGRTNNSCFHLACLVASSKTQFCFTQFTGETRKEMRLQIPYTFFFIIRTNFCSSNLT